jgi:hypothetical protein
MVRTEKFAVTWWAVAASAVLLGVVAAPPASADIIGFTVNSTALLQSDGSIVISGTLACGDAAADIEVLVYQAVARNAGGSAQTPSTLGQASTFPPCDGTYKAWSVVVRPLPSTFQGGRFIVGYAFVQVSIRSLNGLGQEVDRDGTTLSVSIQPGSAQP